MNKSRLALIGVVVVAGLFLAGLLIGGSGKSAAERARDDAQLQLNLERARVSILHGRLALFSVNFGEASQRFDGARAPLQAARERLNAIGRNADAGRVDSAINAIGEAQKLALALDRNADTKAADALREIQGIE